MEVWGLLVGELAFPLLPKSHLALTLSAVHRAGRTNPFSVVTCHGQSGRCLVGGSRIPSNRWIGGLLLMEESLNERAADLTKGPQKAGALEIQQPLPRPGVQAPLSASRSLLLAPTGATIDGALERVLEIVGGDLEAPPVDPPAL